MPADRSAPLQAIGTIDGLGIACEERGHLAPQAELGEVRVEDLQTLDGADILGTLDLQRQPGKIRHVVRCAYWASGIGDRDGDQRDREATGPCVTLGEGTVLPSPES